MSYVINFFILLVLCLFADENIATVGVISGLYCLLLIGSELEKMREERKKQHTELLHSLEACAMELTKSIREKK